MNKKRLVIFNGSPRKNGTSYSFARTIKKLAEDEGSFDEIVHIIEYFDGKKDLNILKSIILQSDIISISTPLYVDTLPYPTIWFFERLSSELRNEIRGKKISPKPQELLTMRIPTVLYYPMAALMNLKIRMIARKNGAVNLEKKVYLE